MIKIMKVRINQGSQAIPDIRKAVIKKPYRGFPYIGNKSCGKCSKCTDVCPSGAIDRKTLSVDIGKCVFCGDCISQCPSGNINFSNFHKISSTSRENLVISKGTTEENYYSNAVIARKEIADIFGRSLKIRQVSAAGCNGCEMELNACSNVNFDMGRFGIEVVASPRHADCILITGPVSANMAAALEDAFQCTPDPKVVILAGACAISGGVFQPSPALNREFISKYKIDLYIPGCPVHPLTVINGILDFLGRK